MTKQIQLNIGKTAIVDDDMYEYLSQWKWYAKPGRTTFYVIRNKSKANSQSGTILMHRAIMNASKGVVVDHINGDGLDNRRENLRLCTNAENGRNRRLAKNNKTGYTGVTLTRSGTYYAHIKVNKKVINLGFFDVAEVAARVRDEAAKKFFGAFAKLNLED
jgi:hypothetical protein